MQHPEKIQNLLVPYLAVRLLLYISKILAIACGILFCAHIAMGQETQTRAFASTQLLNAQTSETLQKNRWAFYIQHRFGQTDIQDNIISDFLGTDLSSNIKFSFLFPIGSRFHIGVGRAKFDELYSGELKYKLLAPTNASKLPLSIALFAKALATSSDAPNIPEGATLQNGDPFSYQFKHRLSYFGQVIAGATLTDWSSVLVAPSVCHHNLRDEGIDNTAFACPVGIRIKTGVLTNIIAEYQPVFYGNTTNSYYGAAFEIKTSSHIFQITITNSNRIEEPYLYYSDGNSIYKGQFYLGFNMHRFFYVKKG